MGVIYNTSAIIPAPLVDIQKEMQLSPDGTKVGVIYNLVIQGTFLAWKGSPSANLTGSNGTGWGGPYNRFWQNSGYPADESIPDTQRLKAIENKQEALRALFAIDGQWLEFQSPDGSAPLKCQPRIKGIHFEPDTWYQTCKYTITADCDFLYLNGNPETDLPNSTELVNSVNESWQIEEGEIAKTYRLSHTCSAVGKRQFDSTGNQIGLAWENAKTFIQNRLVLGFNTTSTFSPFSGSNIVVNSFSGSGSAIDFSSLNNYNYVRNETIDEFAGSYAVTENWLLSAAASGTDVYSISVEKLVNEPDTTTIINVQGQIRGFYTQLNDFDGRYQGALYQWSQVQGTNLYNRIATYATGVAINIHPLLANVDYNPLDGTVNYNYRYSDRPQSGDVYDEYQITKRKDMSDYRTTIGIQGRITGRLYESDTNSDVRWERALTYWKTINPIPVLYNRIINSNFYPEVSGLRQYPTSVNVDINKSEGSITYSYEFNNRENDNDSNNDDVFETYTVSSNFSRDEGKTTYTIAGQVEGLSIVDTSPRSAKYNAANNYWNNVAAPLLLTRVLTNIPSTIYNNNPIATQVEKNPTLGTISYNYQYTNEPAPIIAGALSEVVNVQDSNRLGTVNVFASVPAIARAAGPVLQDMSTTKEKMRSLSIEIVVPPTGSSNYTASYLLKPNTDTIVQQLTPVGQVFLNDDVENWEWMRGRYSRNTSWVYQ